MNRNLNNCRLTVFIGKQSALDDCPYALPILPHPPQKKKKKKNNKIHILSRATFGKLKTK